MYKRNCAKSRKKLGGVYLLGGSHRSVGEHSICSRGSMQASTPTGKSVAKSHPSPAARELPSRGAIRSAPPRGST